jgi:hypothetical protein
MPYLCNVCYNGSLVTWTDECLTAASLSLLYVLYVASPCPMFRTFALSWFYMTSPCYLHNCVIKSYMYEVCHKQFEDRFVVSKVSSDAEKFVLQALQFRKIHVWRELQAGQAWVFMDLISASWTVSLMLAFNRSHLKGSKLELMFWRSWLPSSLCASFMQTFNRNSHRGIPHDLQRG